ncbi:tetratricopeptide repeat protein [bacterium]|nr:tetratricopeptide repeat protein [bacterium]
MSKFNKIRIGFGLLAFLLYAHTYNFKYALDDILIITDNEFTQNGFDGLKDIFSHNYADGGKNFNDGLYRPLSPATFAMEVDIFGSNHPGISHLINAFCYGLIILLLITYLNCLALDHFIIYVTAFLFMIHPVHTEVVANIKGRDDLFSMLFGLVFGLCFHLSLKRPKYMIPAVLSLVLALLSKETSLVFCILFPLLSYATSNRSLKSVVLKTSPYIAITLGFFLIRSQIINSMAGEVDPGLHALLNNPIAASKSLGIQLGTAFKLQALYLTKMIVPYPLIHDYSYNLIPLVSFTSPLSIIGFVLFAGGVAIGLYYGLMKKRVWAMAIAFYLGALFITSNILVHIGALFAERFLFVPSFGLLLAFAFLLQKLYVKRKMATIGIISLISMVFVFIGFQRSLAWKDNLTLFSTDFEKGPESARIDYNYATVMMDLARGNKENSDGEHWKIATQQYHKAIEIYPDYYDALNNLGNAYRYVKDYDKAEFYLKKIIKINPKYGKAYYNLGVAYFESEQYEKCLNILQKYVKLVPNHSDTWFMMGKSAGFLGNFELAEQYLQKALSLKPDIIEFQYLYASSLAFQGKDQKAELAFRHLLDLAPNHYDGLKNLAILYFKTQRLDKALEVLQKAKDFFPEDPVIAEMYATALMELNNGK